MSKVKVKLIKKGVIKLLKSKDVMTELLKDVPKTGQQMDYAFFGFDRAHVALKGNNHNAN